MRLFMGKRGTCEEASATPQALVRQPREIPPLFSLALALPLSLTPSLANFFSLTTYGPAPSWTEGLARSAPLYLGVSFPGKVSGFLSLLRRSRRCCWLERW